MKKKKTKTPPKRWIVARSIYNDSDYEVWEFFTSEEECKEYITNLPIINKEDFFYFQRS
jgi:hypothetical protein